MERHNSIAKTRVPAESSVRVSFVSGSFKDTFAKVSFFAFSFWRLFTYYYYYFYYYKTDIEYVMGKCNNRCKPMLTEYT